MPGPSTQTLLTTYLLADLLVALTRSARLEEQYRVKPRVRGRVRVKATRARARVRVICQVGAP